MLHIGGDEMKKVFLVVALVFVLVAHGSRTAQEMNFNVLSFVSVATQYALRCSGIPMILSGGDLVGAPSGGYEVDVHLTGHERD